MVADLAMRGQGARRISSGSCSRLFSVFPIEGRQPPKAAYSTTPTDPLHDAPFAAGYSPTVTLQTDLDAPAVF